MSQNKSTNIFLRFFVTTSNIIKIIPTFKELYFDWVITKTMKLKSYKELEYMLAVIPVPPSMALMGFLFPGPLTSSFPGFGWHKRHSLGLRALSFWPGRCKLLIVWSGRRGGRHWLSGVLLSGRWGLALHPRAVSGSASLALWDFLVSVSPSH